jgi:hypothetical protein
MHSLPQRAQAADHAARERTRGGSRARQSSRIDSDQVNAVQEADALKEHDEKIQRLGSNLLMALSTAVKDLKIQKDCFANLLRRKGILVSAPVAPPTPLLTPKEIAKSLTPGNANALVKSILELIRPLRHDPEVAHPRLPGCREADEVRERRHHDRSSVICPNVRTPRPSLLLPWWERRSGGSFLRRVGAAPTW